MMRHRLAKFGTGLLVVVAMTATETTAETASGYRGPERVGPILERTMVVRLAPDLSALTPATKYRYRLLRYSALGE